MRKSYLSIFFLLLILNCNKKRENKKNNQVANDSIVYSVNHDGFKTKTIFYPSIKKDSFILRAHYINEKLKDSGFYSKNGFIKGKLFSPNEDKSHTIYEFINIDGESIVNQYWTIKDGDTLSSNGNYYSIRIFDMPKDQKYFQVQIALVQPKDENFTNLFFLRPKNGFELKQDFSNYRDVKYDTIYSFANSNNENPYDDFWSKRIVAYAELFESEEKNFIRGILVERKDTTENNKKFIQKERYLFVNEEINVLRNNDAELLIGEF